MANYTIELYKLLESYGFELFDFEYSFYCDDEKVKKEFGGAAKDAKEGFDEVVDEIKDDLK